MKPLTLFTPDGEQIAKEAGVQLLAMQDREKGLPVLLTGGKTKINVGNLVKGDFIILTEKKKTQLYAIHKIAHLAPTGDFYNGWSCMLRIIPLPTKSDLLVVSPSGSIAQALCDKALQVSILAGDTIQERLALADQHSDAETYRNEIRGRLGKLMNLTTASPDVRWTEPETETEVENFYAPSLSVLSGGQFNPYSA